MALKNIIEFEYRHRILIKNLNQTGIGVDIVDEDYNIIYNNEVLSDKFGVNQGLKCYEYYLQINSPCENCPMKRALRNKDIEKEIKSTPDNRTYEIISAPLPNQDGTLDRAVEIIIDITEKREFEQRLQESEDIFKMIADLSSIGIGIIQDNIVKYVNTKVGEMFGYDTDDIINWGSNEFLNSVYPEDRNLIAVHVQKKQAGKRDYFLDQYQFKGIKKSGETFWMKNYTKSIIHKGKPADLVMLIDITEKQEAEQKLKKSEKKLGERVKELTCLYELSKLVENPAISLGDIINGTLNLIPPAWQFPDLTTARITYERKKFKLSNFEETEWKLSTIVEINEKPMEIEVFYLEDKPFLKEEHDLINEIGIRLKTTFEEKEVQKKLQLSEDKYRLLFENSPIGISLSTFEGKILDQNDAMGKLTGYTLEELNKIGIFAVYAVPNKWLKIMDLLKEIGEVHDYEVKLRRKDNSEIHTSLSLDLFEFEGKKIIQSALRDVTEEKKAELELIKLYKLKSELLTRTSHELKTPAMHIKGYTNLLLEKFSKTLGVEELSIINHIKKGCVRLETLIFDILQKAELDSGKGEIKKRLNDLSSLLQSCVRELKKFAGLRGQIIKLNIHDEIMIEFDRDQIHHVISNIMSNAIKYTEPNGVIEINSKITEDSIEIAIQDNGIGFTEKEKKRLFTQFGKIERYGQGFDVISEGTGIGLYIAKKIIDLHDGEIWVESEGRYKGSTFYFSLPKGE